MPTSNIHFRDTTAEPDRFFQFLPEDWRVEIEPHWPNYAETASIFILETENEILGGGIVFRTVSPDTELYREYAQQQFDKGYWYLAFIWISPDHRGQQLGTEWLRRVHAHYPNQKFWLTIEDYNLVHFYEKSGYTLIQELDLGDWREWVMGL